MGGDPADSILVKWEMVKPVWAAKIVNAKSGRAEDRYKC